MVRSLLTLALVTSSLALVGCDDTLLAAATNAAGERVEVTGSIYAPASQVAVVAAGGLNWRVAARSDEKGVPKATVRFTSLKNPLMSAGSGQTDATGKFTIEVPENSDYVVTATFDAKDGSAVTLTGLVKVTTSAPTFQLDAAHNLVASKLMTKGLKAIDSAALTSLVDGMEDDLSKVSSVPTPTSRAAAASAFDTHAGADTKAAAEAMTK